MRAWIIDGIRAANLTFVERAVKMMLENNKFIPGPADLVGKVLAKSDVVWGPDLVLTPVGVRNLMDDFARVDSRFKVNANAVIGYFIDPLGALKHAVHVSYQLVATALSSASSRRLRR
jgi:hypothetical protein